MRKHLGISQELLADAIGVTFQQVQKYEKGANRVSASKLYEIAKVFKVKVGTFFDGLPDTETGENEVSEIDSFVQQATDVAMAVPAVLQLGKMSRKRQLVFGELIGSMIDDEPAAASA
jgi:transcriptional regulator with XRE-family HTH domain